MRNGLFITGAIVMGGLLLSACNKLGDDNNGNGDTPASGLMAFNLAPDKPALQVALSGSSLTNSPLAYGSYTGNYLAVYTGMKNVEAYDNAGSPFASTPVNFEAKKYYSAFVVGAGGNYQNVVVNDNFDSLSVANGEAYVRYINAIPDSGAAPLVTISANGSNVSTGNAAFTTVSSFTAVTPGDVNIAVSNGGTINANRTINLEQKKAYTVLLVGRPSGAGSTDSIQIKYITNGALSDSSAGRASSSARPATAN